MVKVRMILSYALSASLIAFTAAIIPVLADSESGGVFFGGDGSESGGPMDSAAENETNPSEWGGSSESGGPQDVGAESDSGGVAYAGGESESGGPGDTGADSDSGYVQNYTWGSN